MKKELDKTVVKQHAEVLMQKYQSTTTIDVKNRLHTAGFKSFRQDVEKFLLAIAQEEEWQVTKQNNDNTLFRFGEDTKEKLHIFLTNANKDDFLEVQIEQESLKLLWVCTPAGINEQTFSTNRKAINEAKRLIATKKDEGLVESALPEVHLSTRKLWQAGTQSQTLAEIRAGFFNVVKTTEAQTPEGEFFKIVSSVGGIFGWKKDSQASILMSSQSSAKEIMSDSFSTIEIKGSKVINVYWQGEWQKATSEFFLKQSPIISESYDFSKAKQYELSLHFTDSHQLFTVNIFDNIEKNVLQEVKTLMQESAFR